MLAQKVLKLHFMIMLIAEAQNMGYKNGFRLLTLKKIFLNKVQVLTLNSILSFLVNSNVYFSLKNP